MAIITWEKKYGETLNEMLKRFRLEEPTYINEKITYAGRLDPMAEGLILLLTGEDIYRKEDFLNLDKMYEVDVMFGPDTDTYDILGVLTDACVDFTSISENTLAKILEKNVCIFDQEYPPYSSKTVQGKPLFVWAREGRIEDITIPTKKVEIKKIEYMGQKNVSTHILKNEIIKYVTLVVGDFRQREILEKWHNFFSLSMVDEVTIYTIRVYASSGAYMRSLVKNIGVLMGIPAISLKIKRISIGTYHL